MTHQDRYLKTLTLLLLMIQLCLPISGAFYLSSIMSSGEAGHNDLACAHTDADNGHESQGGHGQIPHCHELDAPCEAVSRTLVKYSPLISPQAASYNGAFLHGYGAPLEFPPKNIV